MRIGFPHICVFQNRLKLTIRQSLIAFLLLGVAACSSFPSPKSASNTVGLIGASDEIVRQSGEKILASNGNAADAMAAMLMTASVAMPSRAGLGASGMCQILDSSGAQVKTLDFTSRPMSFDRKIAAPALARGVFLLQSRYGIKPWKDVLADPIAKAERGVKVSETLGKDILMTGGLKASWKQMKTGDVLKQPKLAATLRTLSSNGAAALYNGKIATSIVGQSDQIIQEDLKNFKAFYMDSIDISQSGKRIYFANPSTVSSEGYMLWRNHGSALKADEVAQSMTALADKIVLPEQSVQGEAFLAADKSGLVIVCNVTMGTPFGTRQLLNEGFYLANHVRKSALSTSFLNIIETNPDITDVIDAWAGTSDYALVDGLLAVEDFASYRPELDKYQTEHRKDAMKNFVHLSCEQGYPNHADSCQEKDNISFALKKE